MTFILKCFNPLKGVGESVHVASYMNTGVLKGFIDIDGLTCRDKYVGDDGCFRAYLVHNNVLLGTDGAAAQNAFYVNRIMAFDICSETSLTHDGHTATAF